MNAPKFTLTNESINVYWEGKMYTVQKGSPHFKPLADAIHNENWGDIPGHLTIQKSLNSWAQGKFKVENGTVFHDGQALPSDINSRIVAMHAEGQDPGPLFKFWERLKKNPSKRSVDQLYSFLKHQNIPLTPDGCFLAYKAVRSDYLDKHSGTVLNKPGTINRMPRNQISDDPREPCHEGFHVGAIGYVEGFGNRSTDKILVCKVDPEHVVCVPYDESQQKMRVCEYLVLGHKGDTLTETVHDEPLDLATQRMKASEDEDEASDVEDDDEEENEVKDTPPSSDEDEDYPGYDPEEDPLSDENTGLNKDKDAEDEPRFEGKISDLMNEEADKGVHAVEDKKETKPKKEAPSKKDFAKHAKMNAAALMNLSIDDLRKYATYGLHLVGASKIPGGKTALVARIVKMRKS